MRVRHKETACVCAVCGMRFIAFSARAKTCTEVCRKRLSRQRRRLAELALSAMNGNKEPRARVPVPVSRPATPSPIAMFLRLALPAVGQDAAAFRR